MKKNKLILWRALSLLVAIPICLSLSGCVEIKYSFTGAQIPVGATTFSVDYFQNRALLVVPTLSTTFTDKLRDYIEQHTKLVEVTDGTGDIRFEGEITGYTQKPINITSGEVAQSNRLTIEIHCVFTCEIDDSNDFDSRFSQYSDYDIDADYDSIEEDLIDEITDDIVEDIYNKAFVNW